MAAQPTAGRDDGTGRVTMARLPPLNALRAFVVTAQQRSFRLAAAQLHVSTAAINQQIRLLEEHLGGALFIRNRGELELTPLAESLLPGLGAAFQHMVDALSGLGSGRAALRISVPPSFAMKWLMPRLDALHEAVPGLELVIEASVRLADFDDGQIDCAIRYGSGQYRGLAVRHLMAEAVLPVCSPGFARDHDLARRGPAALAQGVALLHEAGPEHDTSCPGWPEWLQAHGVIPPEDGRGGIRLQQSSLVLEAAAAGNGIGLGKLRLAEADLAAGRLVSPFGTPWPVTRAYHFVTPDPPTRNPAIAALLDWLSRETRNPDAALAHSPKGTA